MFGLDISNIIYIAGIMFVMILMLSTPVLWAAQLIGIVIILIQFALIYYYASKLSQKP